MKQYISLVIVFIVCLLAIACAWVWRISQRTAMNKEFTGNVVNNIIVYEDKVNIYE